MRLTLWPMSGAIFGTIDITVADLPRVREAFAEMETELRTALWAEGVLRAENDHLRDEIASLRARLGTA